MSSSRCSCSISEGTDRLAAAPITDEAKRARPAARNRPRRPRTAWREYTNLNRDYDVLRKNHEELLGRRESMRIASAADTDAEKIKIQVVDPPQVPQNPVAPKRMLILSGVLAAGSRRGHRPGDVAGPVRQSFHTIDELRELGLPVAGSISMARVVARGRALISALSFSVAVALLVCVYAGLLVRLLRTAGVA